MQSFILLSILCGVVVGQYDEPELFLDLEKDVQIDLYTLKNQLEPQLLIKDNITSIKESNYNPRNPTRIFVHGWLSKGEMKGVLTEAYLDKGKYNFNLIGINWERASSTLNYLTASRNVEKIGIYAAEFVDFMIQNGMLKMSNLRLIGFSLGAHIVGIIGKNVKSGQIPKITGLDPASPLFALDKPHERLDINDAKYVEIIHTNGGRLGFLDPIGTVSFYPNGGRSQPGCSWDLAGMCSHQCAYKYFADSILSSTPIYGHHCETLDQVKEGNCTAKPIARLGGEPGAYKQPKGIYYLTMTTQSDVRMRLPTKLSLSENQPPKK